jgi:acetylornithine deacetylase/succinyl-diaminopimelate desuccinylase-like protein
MNPPGPRRPAAPAPLVGNAARVLRVDLREVRRQDTRVAPAEPRGNVPARRPGDGSELETDSGYGPVTFGVPGGENALAVPLGTDAPHLEGFGKRFPIGPGRIEDAHSEAQHPTAADFTLGVAAYERLLRTLLADDPG